MPDIAALTGPQLADLLTPEQVSGLFSEIGRRHAAKRKTVERPCEVCGQIMSKVTSRRRTCSDVCRSKLFYWERRAKQDPAAAHRLRLQVKGWLPALKGE